MGQALATAEEVGFTWKADPDAPGRYNQLRLAVTISMQTGKPLPISSENNDSIIYLTAEANLAYRFWHDVNHVRLNLTFGVVDELELALWHLAVLEAAGFTKETLSWQMLHADLVGQVQLMALTRRFPLDQARFVNSCLVSGVDVALLEEARRREQTG
jgi:hypothetical protein